MGAERQPAALVDELHRIVHQIVYRAVQMVAVAHDDQPVIKLALYLQLLFLDLLLEGEDDLARHGGEIERRRTEQQLTRLDLRRVEHTVDHARQTARLLRDDAQILVALLLGNGAVDHAVHEAADRRHRRFELMADIRDKAARQLLELIEIARHVVERDRQLVDLIAVIVLGDAHIEVAGGKFLRRRRDILDRARDMLRQNERDNEHRGERHEQDEHERLRRMPHYAGRCRVLAGYEDERRDIAVAVAHAAADRVARRLGQHADRTDRGIAAAARELGDHLGRHAVAADAVGGAVRMRRHLHLAALVRDEDGQLVLLGDARDGKHVQLAYHVRVRALHELALLGKALHRGLQLGLLGAQRVARHLMIEHAAGERERNDDQNKVGQVLLEEKAAFFHRLLLGLELVANAPDRFQLPFIRHALELFAQALDVHVDRARISEVVEAPYLIEQLCACEYAVGT